MAHRQVVTRDEFEAFLADQDEERPSFDILRDIPEAQRQLLFDIGKSICKINNPGGNGSGFHLGGGWIMTALHVISGMNTMGAEDVSTSTFHFPTKPVIEAAFRTCILPTIPPNAAAKKVMDIALIHVPEACDLDVLGLVDPFQAPPKAGDRAHLVHFGNDGRDQLFSINGNIRPDSTERPPACCMFSCCSKQCTRYKFSRFEAYSPKGSSGAPLLTFREERKKFMVGGVHFEGDVGDEWGHALWFTHEHWLQSTVRVASDIVAKILPDNFEHDQVSCYLIDIYKRLQEHLKEHNLRIILDKARPSFLKGAFDNIIFKPE